MLGVGRCGPMRVAAGLLSHLVGEGSSKSCAPPVLIRHPLHQLAQVLSQLNVRYQQVTYAIKVEIVRVSIPRSSSWLPVVFLIYIQLLFPAVSLAGL